MTGKFFTPEESGRISYFRIPKDLFSGSYKAVSTDAKLVYGILLDRMDLSRKNGWIDAENHVYVVLTVEDIQELIGCGNKKAGKLLDELETAELIFRKRQGLGKPNLLYPKMTCQEVSKRHVKKCQNDTSRSVKTTCQEVSKRHANNTNINNTELNYTELNNRATPYSVSDVFADYAGTDLELLEALRGFEKMRQEIKKPLTDRAKKMIVNKLEGYPAAERVKILDQSTTHCWQDIYPLKTEEKRDTVKTALQEVYNTYAESEEDEAERRKAENEWIRNRISF